jgi:DNA-binding SARP family transcriptional activator/tetratricopeptide (TPR) repeat protein
MVMGVSQMKAEFRFALLGPLVLLDGTGTPVTLPGPRLRMLLAALLLHANTPVSLDALADAVWESAPPRGADATLRSHVSRLRRALGPLAGSRVVAHDPGYLIRVEESEFDILRFEALCRAAAAALQTCAWAEASTAAVRALELWRAAPLLDVPSRVLRDGFVPRLEQLRLEVLEERIEAELHLGWHRRLVPEIQALVDEHPFRERFHGQLMLALYRCGRRAEALEVYQNARRLLVAELGIDPGPEIRDLHRGILEDAPALAVQVVSRDNTALVAARPRQLPAMAGHFVGRSHEIETLVGLSGDTDRADDAVVVAAIDGMAGIGKTALAVHAGHRLAKHFPDGQLFLDLRGYSHGMAPRAPADVLAVILEAYGVPPQQIPADLQARAALYRDRLAGTRTLIVLDNAIDEAQIRPLLPGTGRCLVLVTSRRCLKALDDAHVLSLDVLSAADAVALFRAVAGLDRIAADDPLIEEVARLCGRLPLALRIAAALLCHRPSWPLAHLAEKLRAAQPTLTIFSDGERDLATVFDLSLRALTDDQRLVFRRLGLVPGPNIDARAAAAVTGIDPADAEQRLQELIDHNLLTEPKPGRYQMYDLVRLYTRHLAEGEPAAQRTAARNRLLDYYQRMVEQAETSVARYGHHPHLDSVCTPTLRDPEVARAWLRAERANILACIEDAAARSQDTRVVALTAGLATLLRIDGPWSQARDLHAAAAAAAERLEDRHGQATALTNLGAACRMTGDYPRAIRVLERALDLNRGLDDRFGQAAALSELGVVRRMTADHPGAVRDLEQALALHREVGDCGGESASMIELGIELYLVSEHSGAIRALERALDLNRRLGNRLGHATALTYLGGVRRAAGDLPTAVENLKEALALHRSLDNPNGQATALGELGAARWSDRDYPGAIRDMEAAIEIFRGLGSRMGEATTLTTLGAARRDASDHQAAGRDLERALELFRALGARGNEAWALNHYAAVFTATDDFDRALALHGEALDIALDKDVPEEQALALEGIGQCLVRAGDIPGGAASLNQALEIFQGLKMPDVKRVEAQLAELHTL